MRTQWKKICLIVMLTMHHLIISASEPDWQCNIYNYQYDMAVYASLTVDQETVNPDQFILAAFCGEECRGTATVESTEQATYYYLRIRSNKLNGEKISFRVYDKIHEKEVQTSWLQTFLDFESDSRIGFPSTPYPIVFNPETVYHTISILPSPNGTVSGGGNVAEGLETTLTATPDKGYEFTEWTDGTRINPYIFKVTEDKEIGAVFTPKKYKISYIINGDTVFTDSVTYQASIIPPKVTEKEGYRFQGWLGLPSIMPASDIEVYGKYLINRYAIEYYVDDQAYATDSLEYGSPIALRPEPTKDGYEFSGWSTVPDLMPAHNIRVDGNFVKITGIETNKTNTQLLVDVYSINGVLIKKAVPLDLVNQYLSHGIYLINGQKFIVKP